MYTSGIDTRRNWIQSAFWYLLISIFFAVFGAVYECFSHDVYSFYMIYGFMIPLVGGVFPFLCLGLCTKADYPKPNTGSIYHCGIMTLTAGSIVQGILDIYGTSNRLVWCYWIAGSILIVTAIFVYLSHGCFPKEKDAEQAEQKFKSEVIPVDRNQCMFHFLLLSLIIIFTSISALKMVGLI